MYLLKADYKSRINSNLLDTIIIEGANEGEDVLETCSKIAVDTIAMSVNVLYDSSGEWVKTITDRNYLLFSWALSIAVYELYQRIDDEQVPEKVIKNYNDTLDDLDKVALGKKPLNLPPRVDEVSPDGDNEDGDIKTDGNGLRRMGSRVRRSHEI